MSLPLPRDTATHDTDPAVARRAGKSAAAFRTISEVATDLDVPPHVLRFWESKFPQIKPLKRGGGRRYYRPEDIELLRRIRVLLYRDGYTIKGVQKLLRGAAPRVAADDEAPLAAAESPPRPAPAVSQPAAAQPAQSQPAQSQPAQSQPAAPLLTLPPETAPPPQPQSVAEPLSAPVVTAPVRGLDASSRAAVEAAISALEQIRDDLLGVS